MATDKKIISINRELGRQTPREVLAEALAKAEHYSCVIVMAERKPEVVEAGSEPYEFSCSDMSVADANYLLDVGKFMLFHSEE